MKYKAIMLLATAMLLATSCKPQPVATTSAAPAPQPANSGSASELPQAVDALRKLAEGWSPEGVNRTYFYFNQWLASYEPAKAAWQPDKLLEHLPLSLKNTPGLDRLDRNRFEKDDALTLWAALQMPPEMKPDDAKKFREAMVSLIPAMQVGPWLSDMAYFQQTLWLHDIAERVAKQSPPAKLKPWLKEFETGVGLPEAEQLQAAERLFDWTIRNVQLDPLPPMPKAPAATVDPTTKTRLDPVSPAQLGEVGPGYAQLPVQVLLYGHADAHERARIFIQLCRQAGIDAVMLAVNDEASPIPRPWTAAVLVGGQLYLFDTALALPLPGPEGQGIATLDQVAANPELLKQLDVEGQPPYPVGPQDLRAVIALIDAEPAALSRRMQHLQAGLPRESRLVLFVRPSELEAKIKNGKHNKAVSTVSLWRAPLEAIVYQVGRLATFPTNKAKAAEFDLVQNIFSPGQPLHLARNLHLQGRLTDGEREPGARTLYLMCRKPDRDIQAMRTNPFFRAAVGLQDNPNAKASERDAMLEYWTRKLQTEKQHATYWLGLSYYEEGNLNTTLTFLGQRTISAATQSPWESGARYNLARCYEDLGQLELARQWLESDKDSPQRTGNLLRAKWLAGR